MAHLCIIPLSSRLRDHVEEREENVFTVEDPSETVSSGHGKSIVLMSSAVVACTGASKLASRVEGLHEHPLLTEEQLTVDSFSLMVWLLAGGLCSSRQPPLYRNITKWTDSIDYLKRKIKHMNLGGIGEYDQIILHCLKFS